MKTSGYQVGYSNLNRFIFRIVESLPGYKPQELERMPLHELLDLHEHLDIQIEHDQYERELLEKKWARSES